MGNEESCRSLIVKYALKNIFNADKTGLFFKVLPEKKILAFKMKHAMVGKG